LVNDLCFDELDDHSNNICAYDRCLLLASSCAGSVHRSSLDIPTSAHFDSRFHGVLERADRHAGRQISRHVFSSALYRADILLPHPDILGRLDGAGARRIVLDYNPFYYMLNLTRGSLLGNAPRAIDWGMTAGFTVLMILLWLFFFGAFRRRVIFWLN
jgi:hypothetical protein